MKKAILSSILLLGTTSILADTTMCFKENHSSMSTIENIPLNGGACAGKFSVNDMKKQGWAVDDIKISQTPTGMNFIYILKTPTAQQFGTTQFVGNQAQMEANILAKLEQKKQAEEKAKIEKEVQEAKVDAQKIYVNQCQTCHGAKGEVVKAGVALNSLSVEDMQSSLKDYELGRNGKESSLNAAIHTSNLNSKTIKGIYAYLKDLNNPSKK